MPLTEMKTGKGQWPGGPKEEVVTTQWPALQEMLSQNFAPTTGCLLSEKEKKECAAGVGMGSAAPIKEQRKIIASYPIQEVITSFSGGFMSFSSKKMKLK